MTTGTPSRTYATRLLVVPRSMPTTLLMARQFAFDTSQQIVDVVPFEHPLTKRREHVAPLVLAGAALYERVPARRQLLRFVFVLALLLLDRLPRPIQLRAQLFRSS